MIQCHWSFQSTGPELVPKALRLSIDGLREDGSILQDSERLTELKLTRSTDPETSNAEVAVADMALAWLLLVDGRFGVRCFKMLLIFICKKEDADLRPNSVRGSTNDAFSKKRLFVGMQLSFWRIRQTPSWTCTMIWDACPYRELEAVSWREIGLLHAWKNSRLLQASRNGVSVSDPSWARFKKREMVAPSRAGDAVFISLDTRSTPPKGRGEISI